MVNEVKPSWQAANIKAGLKVVNRDGTAIILQASWCRFPRDNIDSYIIALPAAGAFMPSVLTAEAMAGFLNKHDFDLDGF